jgi:transmembrane sensor
MKYRNYSATDFANDSFFIRWVKTPDGDSDWFWNSFIKENPAHKEEIDKAREMILLFDLSGRDLPALEEIERMRNGLLMSLRAEKEEHRDRMHGRDAGIAGIAYHWLKIAAVIAVFPLVLVSVYFFIGKGGGPIALRTDTSASDIVERINPAGQKSVLRLSDGTTVWLNAASRITYARHFDGKDTRDVYLEGEGFFDVAHETDRPFIVHTSSITIKVLGTSFNVKSYSEEKTIETTLVKGKVRIENPGINGKKDDIDLMPNQRAVFDKESKAIQIREVQAENSVPWRQERLVFDEVSIDDVILQMERWYGVTIHVEKRGDLNCKLSATIEKESLEEVLRLLEASHNISYRIKGRDVFLEGTFCVGGH